MNRALRISEAASLAMHAMGVLASRPDQPFSVRTIAARFGVSEAHLSKVMQRLVKVGLVSSARGPRGGFTLAASPDRVTLLDVFEAIEGPFVSHSCLFGEPICDGTTCILGKVIVDVNAMVHDRLSSTTLDQLGQIFQDESLGWPVGRAPATDPG